MILLVKKQITFQRSSLGPELREFQRFAFTGVNLAGHRADREPVERPHLLRGLCVDHGICDWFALCFGI